MKKGQIFIPILLLYVSLLNGQHSDANIFGDVQCQGEQIPFAGGGVSRITLLPDLVEERSNSLSGSVNYDIAAEKFIIGFTLEGFYTKLNDAFYL